MPDKTNNPPIILCNNCLVLFLNVTEDETIATKHNQLIVIDIINKLQQNNSYVVTVSSIIIRNILEKNNNTDGLVTEVSNPSIKLTLIVLQEELFSLGTGEVFCDLIVL